MTSVSQTARVTAVSGIYKRKPERSGSCSQECSGAGGGPTPGRTVMPRAGPSVLRQRRHTGDTVRRKQSQPWSPATQVGWQRAAEQRTGLWRRGDSRQKIAENCFSSGLRKPLTIQCLLVLDHVHLSQFEDAPLSGHGPSCCLEKMIIVFHLGLPQEQAL